MTSSTQTITPLRQRMIDDMRMRKLSPKTQSSYIRAVRQFAGFLARPPDTATVEDLRRYQLHLVDQGSASERCRKIANAPAKYIGLVINARLPIPIFWPGSLRADTGENHRSARRMPYKKLTLVVH
jgi:hypothetical protein